MDLECGIITDTSFTPLEAGVKFWARFTRNVVQLKQCAICLRLPRPENMWDCWLCIDSKTFILASDSSPTPSEKYCLLILNHINNSVGGKLTNILRHDKMKWHKMLQIPQQREHYLLQHQLYWHYLWSAAEVKEVKCIYSEEYRNSLFELVCVIQWTSLGSWFSALLLFEFSEKWS